MHFSHHTLTLLITLSYLLLSTHRGYTISPSPSCTCPHSSYSPSPYPASNLHPPCSPIRHTHHTHPPYHTTHTHTHAPHHQQQQHTCTQQLHTTTASQQQQHNYSNCPCASPPHSSPAPPPQAMAQLRELLGALSGVCVCNCIARAHPFIQIRPDSPVFLAPSPVLTVKRSGILKHITHSLLCCLYLR